jgi:hypothetical protein
MSGLADLSDGLCAPVTHDPATHHTGEDVELVQEHILPISL